MDRHTEGQKKLVFFLVKKVITKENIFERWNFLSLFDICEGTLNTNYRKNEVHYSFKNRFFLKPGSALE